MRSLTIETHRHDPTPLSARHRADFASAHRFKSLKRGEPLAGRRRPRLAHSRWLGFGPWVCLGILALPVLFVAALRVCDGGS